MHLRRRRLSRDEPVVGWEVLAEYLNMNLLLGLLSDPSEGRHFYGFMERAASLRYRGDSSEGGDVGDEDPVEAFAGFVVRHFRRDHPEGWRTELARWCVLVDEGFDAAPGSVVLANIAGLASAVEAEVEAGVWNDDGFAATRGLVRRVYFARHAAGQPDWWRARLHEVRSEDAALCLAVMLTWAEAGTLANLRREVDDMVEGLTPAAWTRLDFLVDCMAEAAGAARPEVLESWFEGLGEMGPRMTVLMVDRVRDGVARQRLSRKRLGNYRGTDIDVLRYAAKCEGGVRSGEDVDWEFVSQLSELVARSRLGQVLGVRAWGTLEVPEGLAANVLRECDRHCGDVVEVCERSYGRRVAERAEMVSAVAERDGWFTRQL